MSERSTQPIGAQTRYCAVYGHPIKHSASPAMHNAGLAVLGLDWRYLAFEVRPEQLGAAIAGAKSMHFIGLNLTVPHKLLAVGLVDALDESAQVWGAVNTVRFEGRDDTGNWQPLRFFADAPAVVRAHGFNTDADAVTRALREDLSFEAAGRKVLLLGAGGAGRTAALKIAAEGAAEVYLVNRTRAKAAAIAAEISQRFPAVKVSLEYPAGQVDLTLNATSLGLRADDPLPYDPSRFSLRQTGLAYDMIYRPAETQFLKQASAAGRRGANGLGMLLYQGAKALEIWTGQPAPVAAMKQALERNVNAT